MKSLKIFNAITDISDDLINKANIKKSGYKKIWIPLVAACLIITVVCSSFYYRFGSVFPVAAKALASPVYPKTVMIPKDADYSSEQYQKWRDANFNKSVENKDYAEGLDSFLSKSISSFLKDSGNENVVFSPLNLYMSLGMLSEITSGNSRDQIIKALGSENIESVRSRASKMWNYSYRKDGVARLLLANSLWLDTGIKYNQQVLDSLAKNYYAYSFSGNMGSRDINELYRTWINEQTDNLLKDQVSELELTSETVLSLVSIVNFNAKWYNQFDKQKTEQGIFHSPKGDINVDYMKDTIFSGNAYWGDKFTAIPMPLANYDYNMNIILPDEGYSVSELLNDPQTLDFITNYNEYENQKRCTIHKTIPKFDINSQVNLEKGLKQMGISDVFNENTSDFSNITNTIIKKVTMLHGNRVMIDEEGCKAASFVTLSFDGSAFPDDEIDFVVDRPFIFTITDKTGTPIYVGIVNNP